MPIPRSSAIIALGTFCLVAPLAHGQVDPQARRALEGMVAVVQEAETISYRVQMHGEGAMFGLLPRSSGAVTMKRKDPPAPGARGHWYLRIDGKSEGLDKPFDFVVVSDGQRYSWLDSENERLIYRHHSAARGQPTDTATQLLIPTITEANPLERDLAAATIELVEEVELDGHRCDVILVDPGEMQPKMRWTISREDGMPRKAERLVQGGILNDRQIWTITNVNVGREADQSLFTLTAPEGWSVVGAPPRPRTEQPETTGGEDAEADGGSEVRRPAEPAPRTVGTEVGNLAPDFELPTPEGSTLRLSDLRGNVVLLDFWGTWCIPCRRSSPEVQKVHDDYKDKGVRVLGLAVRERNDENPINYMKDHEYTYGLLLRADDVAREYRVRTYPTFVVIGREGEIVHIEGAFDPQTSFKDIRGAIDRALEGKAQEAGQRQVTVTTGDDGEVTTTDDGDDGSR